MKLEKGDCVMCKKRISRLRFTLFEYGTYYKIVSLPIIRDIDIGCGCYVLDRVDDGDREFFYDIEKFDKYFITLKDLRKQKIACINKKGR